MKRIFGILLALLLSSAGLRAQDTTIVQTLTYDSTARAGVWAFPNDSTKTYRKVLMQYSMRCHDLQVGNGNVGCREWDYHCNTVLTDSSRTDSLRASANDHVISNFSGNTYNLTQQPTYTYGQYDQQQVTYSAVLSETTATVGSGLAPQSAPFGTMSPVGRTQFLWTATELAGNGLTAGDISSLRMDVSGLGSAIGFLRIRMKATSRTTLDADNVDLDGFTEVYFLNTQFALPGTQSFNFYNPFTWNGTDNILIEFSYRNSAAGVNNLVNGQNTSLNLGLLNSSADNYVDFSGAEYLDLASGPMALIGNEITVSFWSWGGENLPTNTSVFEGTDANNVRHANVHLPWSNGEVYWDCGNDGTGYDRINLPVSANDYKGRWAHWAFTKNATTGEMKIWLDGQLLHAGNGKTRPINLSNFRVGRGITGNYPWTGRMNDFRVWNVELDSARIRDWMFRDVNASHPNYSGLVAYYKFDETSGNQAADASANAQTSTFAGVPSFRAVRGKDLYRNFSLTQDRPNVTFVKGTYTSNTQVITVRDSTLNAQDQAIAYTVIGTDLVPVDTNNYFRAGWQYVYDENNMIVDSVAAPIDSTITISPLTYYRKGPARFELLSFITPYGNGLDLGPDGVMWQFDVSDYLPVLQGMKRLSVEGVGQNQEEMDIRFLFIEGTPPRDVVEVQQLWPIRSATDIWSGYGFNQILNDDVFEARTVTLGTNASDWKLRSSITGHGQNGEFIARWHWLNVNGGPQEYRYRVWTECADIPVFPQGGTWLYDRAGWCPGAPTDVWEYDLDSLGIPGQAITVDYGMDQVGNTSMSDYRVSNQLVAYGAPNHTLDASLEMVKRPSKTTRYARFNPACNTPIVILRNEGSTTLTSAIITYNVTGGSTRTLNWTGSLEFLEAEEVALPVDNPAFWQGTANVFEASVSSPNGGMDQQADNDVYHSAFDGWASYSGPMDFYWRTNNKPSESVWRLTDENGTVLMQNSPFLSANTTYTETLNLPAGCYTLRFDDSGDDGLSYWANTSQGAGFFRIRNNGQNVQIFEPEFGKFFQFDFYTDGTAVGNAPILEAQHITVSPNPSEGLFAVHLEGYQDREMQLEVYSLTGAKVLSSAFRASSGNFTREVLDLSAVPAGTYLLRVYDGHTFNTRTLVKQ